MSDSQALRRALIAVPVAALVTGLLPPALTGAAQALTTVTTTNGVEWSVNDGRRPGLDTGSIRNISQSRVEGFGNLFVQVSGSDARMNSEMLRGFGLTGDARKGFASTQSVRLGDLLVARQVDFTAEDQARYFDSFTNSSTEELTVRVSFGGSLGHGAPGSATAATVAATGSGDTTIDASDSWAVTTSPNNYRPTGMVIAADGVSRVGDQQNDPFEDDYRPSDSGVNDPGFVHELTLQPGETTSLAQIVVVGDRGDDTAIVERTAQIAAAPDLSQLSLDELCTVTNWPLDTVVHGDAVFDPASCAGADPLQLPLAPDEPTVRTSVDYDVTGKSVAALASDLSAGNVTSVELTQAYLDRIEAYDQTQLGFKAFIHVADDALEQAAEADARRAAGETGPLLGVPIAVKDLYDVEGQPNTGGILSLETWTPESDAWQIASLREAGVVFLGKTNLSEFANSGSFSESGFMQTWNGISPSKTSFGSSGGSATAVAADLAPISLGTQTGVSLYAPSTGASLSTFRGTDGLTSAEGVMPLTWAQDYAGPIGQTIEDLALVLDATATRSSGNNPDDLLTSRHDNDLRPESFSDALDVDALQGKKIGYLASSFASTQVADDTTGAEALEDIRTALEAAGAELVEVETPAPTTPAAPGPITGNSGAHGWTDYIESEPTFPFRTPADVWKNLGNLPYNVAGTSVESRVPYDEESVTNLLTRRDLYKEAVAAWMDEAEVDAVAYPGFLTGHGNNDAASAIFSSDRATGVLTSNVGLPTAVLPIGQSAEGWSNSLQIVGRAWDDADVLAMGYAAEQASKARVHGTFAPALEHTGPADSTLSVTLARTAVQTGKSATAKVSVTSTGTVTGTVRLSVAGKSVTAPLTGGTAKVALPKKLPVGSHLVTASFAGDRRVAPAQATTTLKVDRARSTLASRKKVTVKAGARPKVKVRVKAAAPVKGEVIARAGGRVVASARLKNGRAVLTLPRLTRTKAVKLRYTGSPKVKAVKKKIRIRVR